jgi:hypothetical protein
MKLRYLLPLLCAAYGSLAQAEIYKYVDSNGNVTYSSAPIKGGKKLNLEPLPTMEPFKGGPAFPKVDQRTQKTRDDARRKILQDELANEEKLLADARQKLEDARNTPMVYHNKEGQTFRNVAGYEENVKAAQDEVALHEKNVQAIKTELSVLK